MCNVLNSLYYTQISPGGLKLIIMLLHMRRIGDTPSGIHNHAWCDAKPHKVRHAT